MVRWDLRRRLEQQSSANNSLSWGERMDFQLLVSAMRRRLSRRVRFLKSVAIRDSMQIWRSRIEIQEDQPTPQ